MVSASLLIRFCNPVRFSNFMQTACDFSYYSCGRTREVNNKNVNTIWCGVQISIKVSVSKEQSAK